MSIIVFGLYVIIFKVFILSKYYLKFYLLLIPPYPPPPQLQDRCTHKSIYDCMTAHLHKISVFPKKKGFEVISVA